MTGEAVELSLSASEGGGHGLETQPSRGVKTIDSIELLKSFLAAHHY